MSLQVFLKELFLFFKKLEFQNDQRYLGGKGVLAFSSELLLALMLFPLNKNAEVAEVFCNGCNTGTGD